MRNELLNLAKDRNWKEALLFYFVYLLVIFLFISILGGILAATGLLGETYEEIAKNGRPIGSVMAILICTSLSVAIITKKNLSILSNIVWIILTFISSGLLGSFLGMIVVSYLTTKKSNAIIKNQ